MSDENLISALCKARLAFGQITKNKTAKAGAYSYKYADLADVIAAVDGPLAKNGLVVLQRMEHGEHGLLLYTELVHSGGEAQRSTMPLLPPNGDMQKWGGSLTYARRYSLCALLGIVADDDTDAVETVGDKPPPPSPKLAPRAPTPGQSPVAAVNAAIARSQPVEEPMLEIVKIMEGARALYTGSIFTEALKAYAAVKGRSTDKMATAAANLDALKVLRDHATGTNGTKLQQEIEAAEAITSEAA